MTRVGREGKELCMVNQRHANQMFGKERGADLFGYPEACIMTSGMERRAYLLHQPEMCLSSVLEGKEGAGILR